MMGVLAAGGSTSYCREYWLVDGGLTSGGRTGWWRNIDGCYKVVPQ